MMFQPRGISIIRISVRNFLEPKDFDEFLVDFSLKQQDFAKGVRDSLGVPVGSN